MKLRNLLSFISHHKFRIDNRLLVTKDTNGEVIYRNGERRFVKFTDDNLQSLNTYLSDENITGVRYGFNSIDYNRFMVRFLKKKLNTQIAPVFILSNHIASHIINNDGAELNHEDLAKETLLYALVERDRELNSKILNRCFIYDLGNRNHKAILLKESDKDMLKFLKVSNIMPSLYWIPKIVDENGFRLYCEKLIGLFPDLEDEQL